MSTKKTNHAHVITPRKTKYAIPLQAGDCMYFEDKSHPQLGMPLKELGIKEFAKPVQGFFPNLYSLIQMDDEVLEVIGDITQNLSSKQLRIMSMLFAEMSKVKNLKYSFGQKIYINISAPNVEYLECYRSAYILCASPNKDYVYVSSTLKDNNSSLLELPVSSIITQTQFKNIKKTLIETNHVFLPPRHLNKLPKFVIKPEVDIDLDYEVPTIDTVSQKWLDDNFENKTGKVKKPKANHKKKTNKTISISHEA